MFKSTQGKGFHMTFANGWTVSVQWGAGNFGPNYNVRPDTYEELLQAHRKLGAEGAPVAEVACWKYGSEDIIGFEEPMSPEQVVALMVELAARRF